MREHLYCKPTKDDTHHKGSGPREAARIAELVVASTLQKQLVLADENPVEPNFTYNDLEAPRTRSFCRTFFKNLFSQHYDAAFGFPALPFSPAQRRDSP
jgi:hypothetical protein